MFKFRPAFQTLENRENPSGPDLMDGSGLPPPVTPPPQTPTPPPPAPGSDPAPGDPSNPAR